MRQQYQGLMALYDRRPFHEGVDLAKKLASFCDLYFDGKRKKRTSSIFLLGRIGLVLFLCVLMACAVVKPPSATEFRDVRSGEKAIVLIRFVGRDPEGKRLRAFRSGLVDDSVGIALGSPETGSVPKGRVDDVRFLSDSSRDQGWTYLILPPGTHYLAVQPPRYQNIFTYKDLFKNAPRWAMEVPPRTQIMYAGTLDLHGIGAKGLIFGNTIFVAFDEERSTVRDQETIALKLRSKHFPDLGPLKTVLLEPHHP